MRFGWVMSRVGRDRDGGAAGNLCVDNIVFMTFWFGTATVRPDAVSCDSNICTIAMVMDRIPFLGTLGCTCHIAYSVRLCLIARLRWSVGSEISRPVQTKNQCEDTH